MMNLSCSSRGIIDIGYTYLNLGSLVSNSCLLQRQVNHIAIFPVLEAWFIQLYDHADFETSCKWLQHYSKVMTYKLLSPVTKMEKRGSSKKRGKMEITKGEVERKIRED